ncbi:ExbD/TolR family protein [Longitalea arenae]|uniref:ExbD/TolR family protein n=1 Tax=Longitalea arenae TaxID=2812558 RepID=UPI001968463C|nr:biopolymer transporter ExbD [Longitalea arenae]
MPKVKMPRKSTAVDMTAMCDVAFLLLSFFILTTKFKSPDAVEVVTPNSVSTKPVEAKNVVQVIMDKEGKVFFSVGDESVDEKAQIIDMINEGKSLNLTEQEKAAFTKSGSYVGVPFAMLKSFLQLSPDQLKNYKAPGIPTDTANNELSVWMNAATRAFSGAKMALMVKGDNNAKYPSFKGVIDAFKKNEIFKFSMVTNPEGVPEGTALSQKRATGAKEE